MTLEPEHAAVHAHVLDDIDSLIALGCNSGTFANHAASKLLSINGTWSETYYYMLVSALNRKDARCAKMYLKDWKEMSRRPSMQVSKFVPGDHYHVLGKKFDDLESAKSHLSSSGYSYGGLSEKHVYMRSSE